MCNLYDKSNYVMDVRALNQALDHVIVLKNAQLDIDGSQEAWLELKNIDMYMKLRAKAKNLKRTSSSWKTLQCLKRLWTTETRRHQTCENWYKKNFSNGRGNLSPKKWSSKKLMAKELNKREIKINKLVYSGL